MEDPRSPRIRAAWTARLVLAIDGLPDDEARRIRATIPAAATEAIEARGLAWIAVEHHVAVLNAIVGELGPDSARAFLRAAARKNLQGSLVRGALMAGLRMFGVGPLALLRMFPRGFGTIMQNCGTVRMQRGAADEGTEAIFEDLAPALRVTPFVLSMGALFHALFDTARRDGTVTEHAEELAEGRLRYLLRASDRSGLVDDVGQL